MPRSGDGEPWLGPLQEGDLDGAWDLLVERYRRLILATIRHYADDYDDVMEVFARVCEGLRENELERLRRYAEQSHSARFSTWLVTVVRNLTIDWFRHEKGRPRLSQAVAALPPVQQKIYEYVFHRSRSHTEAYELIRTRDGIPLSFGEFLRELAACYRALSEGRKGRLLRELMGPPPLEELHPAMEASLNPSALSGALEEALQGLDPEERFAVELFVVDEVPAAEVARIVGWPSAKTVYNRVYRTLARLRAALERQGVGRSDLGRG